jgi:hypothetical protein
MASLDPLTWRLLNVIEQTVHPAHLTLWLREAPAGASTFDLADRPRVVNQAGAEVVADLP